MLAAAMPAMPAARPALRERLAAIEGLDLADALGHVGGRLPVLARVLAGFIAAYPQGDPGLQAAAAPGDARAVAVACHSLRGACAAIGARGLPQRLLAVETALAQGQALAGLQPALRQVQDGLQDLVRQLAEALRA